MSTPMRRITSNLKVVSQQSSRRSFTPTLSSWRLPSLTSSAIHEPASTESSRVTRIGRLMSLNDSLSSKTKEANRGVPHRLRGTGLWNAQPSPEQVDSTDALKPLPTTRTMRDSWSSMDLNFSTDEALRAEYVGGVAKVRLGRLMEDFDTVAGAAAYRYILPDGAPIDEAKRHGIYVVTASVDRMDVLRPLSDLDGTVDLRLTGHVAYASESSMEIFIRLATVPKDDTASSTILIGRFAMAARKYSGGKHLIPQLQVENAEEQELYNMGQESRQTKKDIRSKSLETTPPTQDEVKMLHDLFTHEEDLFKRNASTPANVVWMSDEAIRLKSAILMHPQERNVHNKIFGGAVMRRAFEVGYSVACLFARGPVTFIALDELTFKLPVEIGSLLVLDSRVTFSPIQGTHSSFHVSVEASTIDLHTGKRAVTNTFHFTFAADQPLERHVLPRSYKQAMAWLDAQRRRERGIAVRKAYEAV
ncbi:hypothetical protein OIO90_001139 [Microbotryomycetes sp. JL221]|nr:hypothetical protein OIO90_001139 [Microbotryomycetes sp. JL221]